MDGTLSDGPAGLHRCPAAPSLTGRAVVAVAPTSAGEGSVVNGG
jgi:hypothetical protein